MCTLPMETRRGHLIPLELEFQVVVNHQMGILGTKLAGTLITTEPSIQLPTPPPALSYRHEIQRSTQL